MPLYDGPVDYVMPKDHPLYPDIAAQFGDARLPRGAPAGAQAKATRLKAADCGSVSFNTTSDGDKYTIGDFHVIHLQCLEGREDCDLEYKDAYKLPRGGERDGALQRVIAARRASAEHSRLLFEVHATEAELQRYGMYPGGKLLSKLTVPVPDGDGRPVAPEWAVPAPEDC